MEPKKKRKYLSKTRENQAANTRSSILQAAKKLFLIEGFERVTIPVIAQNAGVSVPAIYAIFTSKKGVLQALIDDALPQEQFSALVEQSMNEKIPEKRLAITAKLARSMYDAEKELMDILREASVIAPEFKVLEQEREKRRYTRQADYVRSMMEENSLSSTLDEKTARDVLWALTGRDMYRMLVIEQEWPSDMYEKWLCDLLKTTLLK